jgi:hypothetical protein
MAGELGRSAHVNTSCFRAAAAVAGASANKFALELGKAAQHRQHKPPVWRGRISPCAGKRAKSSAGGVWRERPQIFCGSPRSHVATSGLGFLSQNWSSNRFGLASIEK